MRLEEVWLALARLALIETRCNRIGVNGMNLLESFQLHCQYCYMRFEADSYEAVVKRVEEHEREEHADKVAHR